MNSNLKLLNIIYCPKNVLNQRIISRNSFKPAIKRLYINKKERVKKALTDRFFKNHYL